MVGALKQCFGVEFQQEPMQNWNSLPFYMVTNRDFFELSTGTTSFVVVQLLDEERFGAIALEHQLITYMEVFEKDVAYCFPRLNKIQRDALMNKHIPFICLPNQIYLPFLGISLSRELHQQRLISTEKMTPVTQSLFLHLLYNYKGMPILKKDAAQALHLTKTSITRASAQLSALHLITEESIGRELRMSPVCVGGDYFEQAKPYLINPIQRRITVTHGEEFPMCPLAGESALSSRTMLNSPQKQIYAIAKSDPHVKDLKTVDEDWEFSPSISDVELWKYDPLLFARDNIVDPVSLYLSLQDCHDERIESSIGEYMEGLQWWQV